jgi:hypothetical protein
MWNLSEGQCWHTATVENRSAESQIGHASVQFPSRPALATLLTMTLFK